MRRRLFLTGPIGCGKSTAIAQALGSRCRFGGGFFTRRQRDETGRPVQFVLESPDASRRQVFLDCSQQPAVVHSQAFSQLGVELVEDPRARFVILDEIGGVELLCPPFVQALEGLWRRGAPCIGVLKAQAPSQALIRAAGLPQAYAQAAGALRAFLENDPDTLVYPCKSFDETARDLAVQWCREYGYE